jgi:hypothetical protein
LKCPKFFFAILNTSSRRFCDIPTSSSFNKAYPRLQSRTVHLSMVHRPLVTSAIQAVQCVLNLFQNALRTRFIGNCPKQPQVCKETLSFKRGNQGENPTVTMRKQTTQTFATAVASPRSMPSPQPRLQDYNDIKPNTILNPSP